MSSTDDPAVSPAEESPNPMAPPPAASSAPDAAAPAGASTQAAASTSSSTAAASSSSSSSLSGISQRVAAHKTLVDSTLSAFEASTKKAISYIDKHMRKGVDPNAVPVEQKVDDFKRAAAEFNTSSKNVIKQLKQLSEDVKGSMSDLAAAVQQSSGASHPTDATDEAPRLPPEEDVAAASESSKLLVAQKDQRIAELETQLAESEKKLAAVLAAPPPPSTAPNPDVALKSERDALAKEVETLQGQCRSMDNAFRNVQDTFFREKESMQKAVDAAYSQVEEKDLERRKALLEAQRFQEIIETLQKEIEDVHVEKRALVQRLEFAEKKRECDFTAFEHATRDHEKDLHEWQLRYTDAMGQVSRLNREKESLQARVVDEHLREHIRVLQKENSVLRDEKVRAIHAQAKDPNIPKVLTAALQDTVASLHRDKAVLAEQLTTLNQQLHQKELMIHEMEVKHVEERSLLRREAEELDRRLRFFELKRSEENMAIVPHGVQQQQQQQTTMTTTSTVEMSPSPSRQGSPLPPPPLNTWDRGVQVDDVDRAALEREIVSLRCSVRDLQDEVERLQQSDKESRTELQEKLIQQMKNFASQVEQLEKDSKVRAFKLSKAQQQNEALEHQLREQKRTLDALRIHEGQVESKLQDEERRFMSLEMENEELKTKVKVLRREIEDLHQQAAEENASKLLQLRQQQQQQQVNGTAATRSRSPTATNTPRSGGGSGNGAAASSPPTTAPSTAAAARLSRLDAVKKLDDLLLELHQQSVNLDADESRVSAENEQRQEKRQQRIGFLEAARPMWERETRQRGPNGEAPIDMVRNIEEELNRIREEEKVTLEAMRKYFLNIATKRDHMHQATTKIIEKRNQLMDSKTLSR